MTKPLLQLTLVLGLGLSTAGCDTVSSAADSVGSAISDLNPFGGSDDSTPAQTADASASSDATASTSPDLANLPPPPTSSTAAQQQAAAQSLAADGAQARYSADNLRAGTESAAPPPTADAPPSAALAAAAAPSASDAPPSAGAGASSSAAPSATDLPPSAAAAPSAAPSADMPPSAAASTGPSASAPAVASAAPPAARQAAPAPAAAPPPSALTEGTGAVPVGPGAPVRTAALPPPSSVSAAPMPAGAEPAVPPTRAGMAARGGAMAMAAQAPSDAALGFQPSGAPPLDPSINQWVAAPIVAHYRQTAANAGVSVASNAAVPARGATAAGSVEAFNNGGVTPTAVVLFPGDGTTLSAAARNQIRSAVSQYKANGGDGSIRVVGHASSRTANMPVEKHLELIFDKSQARANAVAQELIHEGVPAAKVLVEAVGDSQPVYYESMPQGEDGNRRAEIFVQ